MKPAPAERPAVFSTLAMPFSRRMAMAFSRAPPASSKAFLQVTRPAPVSSRSFCSASVLDITLRGLLRRGLLQRGCSRGGGLVGFQFPTSDADSSGNLLQEPDDRGAGFGVAEDGVFHVVRIGVGVRERDARDAQAVGLGHSGLVKDRVDHDE